MTKSRFVSMDVTWQHRTASILILMILLPNALGMVNMAMPWGGKVHLFQAAIILTAALFGPGGGAISGFAGSIHAALMTGNPYLMIGNALLGFCVGLFLRKGFPLLLSVWLAFGVQLPWLILTDLYLVLLPADVVRNLVITLFLSDTLWAVAVRYALPLIRKRLFL